MNIPKLVIKNLFYHSKRNILSISCISITTIILVGALVLGDSIKRSLIQLHLDKIGKAKWTLKLTSTKIDKSIASKMEKDLHHPVIPLHSMNGQITNSFNKLSLSKLTILGVTKSFFSLSSKPPSYFIPKGKIWINETLASKLKLSLNDKVKLKFREVSSLGEDSPFSKQSQLIGAEFFVDKVLKSNEMGNFSLNLSQETVPTAFLNIKDLFQICSIKSQVNLLLSPYSTKLQALDLNHSLMKQLSLADLGLSLEKYPKQEVSILSHKDVFFPKHILPQLPKLIPYEYFFSYFINRFSKGKNKTPYSIISSSSKMELKENEIVINQWLADDLEAKENDLIDIEYYTISTNRSLELHKASFKVIKIIPMIHPLCSPNLMPNFPGLASSGDCKEWDTKLPIDLKQIRDKDEKYWEKYRGTPKAFISLKRAQSLFKNPYGNLTHIQIPVEKSDSFMTHFFSSIDLKYFNLFFKDIRKAFLEGTSKSVNFSQLFIGLSFFIIFSSLILTGLFFSFSMEHRKKEIGTFKSLGYSSKKIFFIYMAESASLSFFGCILGTLLSPFYVKSILFFLSHHWFHAIRMPSIQLNLEFRPIIIGFSSSLALSMIPLMLRLKFMTREHASNLQKAIPSSLKKPKSPNYGSPLSIILFIAISLCFILMTIFTKYEAILFALLGLLSLLLGLSLFREYLLKAPTKSTLFSIRQLTKANIKYNLKQYLSVSFLLSIGIFILTTVSSNKRSIPKGLNDPNSGTGGFSYLCELTHPIPKTQLALFQKKLSSNISPNHAISCVPVRVLEGDDGSCLNINQVRHPKILGINSEDFSSDPFHFVKSINPIRKNTVSPWLSLKQNIGHNSIPAVGDLSMIKWNLKKGLGESISYSNEKGSDVNLKIIGALNNSILQGSLVVDESNLLHHFPSVNGYGMLLFGPIEKKDEKETLQKIHRILGPYGPHFTSTEDRLSTLYSVENTYLSIFFTFGSMGLLLGTLGLGALLLKNLSERQKEFSIYRALGFSPKQIKNILIQEYSTLLWLSILSGFLSATLALIPIIEKYRMLQLSWLFALLPLTAYISLHIAIKLLMKTQIITYLREE